MTEHALLLPALLRVHVILVVLVIPAQITSDGQTCNGFGECDVDPNDGSSYKCTCDSGYSGTDCSGRFANWIFSTDLPVNFETLLKQMVVMIMIVIVVHVLSMVVLLCVHVTLVILVTPAQITCVMDKVAVGLVTVKSIQMIRKATSATAILDIQEQIAHQTIA